ncbi:Erg28 like protein-domain-containing protein [Suillus paluster]|uniref:Erg28 like protein-domain-containing protein n=1 Tax=Suillus paluster TaxID=48578 RepID=UPI001B874FCC|nr:Erg28 like protein-domain-containing protein [Suillus paluster]KAG1733623.1 Erg28 like protein-domain-containing protein [Suillus paluster]
MATQMLLDYLPKFEGLLPTWQLIVATMAVFNTIQNFATLKLTRRLYTGVPSSSITALQARTFAAWTITSAVIRGYAAYNINNKTIYDMALLSYLIAFGHFTSEICFFRTAKINGAALSPVIVSTTSLIWMLKQYEFYVKP